jgi:hypothetical protein
MRTPIDMAKEAGFMLRAESVKGQSDWWECFDEAIEKLVALARADERRSKPHSLGPGEMELSLRRNHKDDLFECRRRFSAEEVVLGPDFLVEATAKMLDAEMNRAIRARGNT